MANDQDLQPALDAAQNQLGLTFSTSDTLDGKALAILGYDLAIGIFALQSKFTSNAWMIVLLFVTLTASLIVTLLVIIPRKYGGAIVDLDEHPEYLELSHDELVAQLLSDTQDNILRNNVLNARKTRLCTAAITGSFIGTILLIGCIIKL